MHKTLVAASRMHAKGTMAILGALGGAVVHKDSWTGRKILELAMKARDDSFTTGGWRDGDAAQRGPRATFSSGAGETVVRPWS